jgi:hypothetical protein
MLGRVLHEKGASSSKKLEYAQWCEKGVSEKIPLLGSSMNRDYPLSTNEINATIILLVKRRVAV